MGLLDKLQSKLELHRLEKKYARRKNRSTFVTDAQYVDGEYVYSPASEASSPSTTTSKHSNGMWTAPRGGWR